jgi:transcriptional antiterminator RfaH
LALNAVAGKKYLTGHEIMVHGEISRSRLAPSGDPDCGCHTASWYVVQAAPAGLYIAFNKLSAATRDREPFRCHLPRLVVGEAMVMRHGRPVIENGNRVMRERIEPFFPGYLFVSFDIAQPGWGDILRTEGVAKLISRKTAAGWTPTRLPLGLVESLQARGRAGDGVIDTRAPAFPPLAPGVRGTVLSGPFSGYEAVTTMPSSDRVRVLLELFGRQTSVDLPRADFAVT